MPGLMTEFVKEAYKHPLFVLLLAVVLSGWMVFSLSQFAFATEVEQVREEVRSISRTVERSSLENRVHSLEAEIFTLERLVAEGAARDMDYNRLARLRSELGTAKRSLARVD